MTRRWAIDSDASCCADRLRRSGGRCPPLRASGEPSPRALRSVAGGRVAARRRRTRQADRTGSTWRRPCWWQSAGNGRWSPGCDARAGVESCARRCRLPGDGRRRRAADECGVTGLDMPAAAIVRLLAGMLHRSLVIGSPGTIAGEEPRLGPAHAPPVAQDLQQLGRQHHVAVLLAFALLDADDHPLAVDVGGLQMNRFRDAQAGGIAGGQDGAMLEVGDAAEELQDFLGTEDDGQLLRLLGSGMTSSSAQSLLERHLVEETQRRDGDVDRAGRQLLLVGQIDLIGPNLLGPETSPATCRSGGRTATPVAGTTRWVCGERLRTCMSSIMRCRSGVIDAPLRDGLVHSRRLQRSVSRTVD